MEITTDYKKAIEQMILDGIISQEEAVKYCPDLVESEDEKIRKSIIDIIKSQKEQQCHIDSTIYDEMLAWLEKQGEQKTENILTDDDSLQTAYLKGQTDVLENPEKYGLSKSVILTGFTNKELAVDTIMLTISLLKSRNLWPGLQESLTALAKDIDSLQVIVQPAE